METKDRLSEMSVLGKLIKGIVEETSTGFLLILRREDNTIDFVSSSEEDMILAENFITSTKGIVHGESTTTTD